MRFFLIVYALITTQPLFFRLSINVFFCLYSVNTTFFFLSLLQDVSILKFSSKNIQEEIVYHFYK